MVGDRMFLRTSTALHCIVASDDQRQRTAAQTTRAGPRLN
jgi:hypothetical protein